MSKDNNIDQNKSDQDKYELLVQQIDSLIDANDPIITNLSNITAAINQTFSKVSWVGFYLLYRKRLILGPFQGKVACTRIEIGKGVCGTSYSEKRTLVVENVDEFPGHIACDIDSKSEIVIPLISGNNSFGVLDLDSHEYSSFNQTDKLYLEKICQIIVDKLNFTKLKIT